MIDSQVALLIRQLGTAKAVVTGSCVLPATYTADDDPAGYYRSELTSDKNKFIEQFPEFADAVWTVQVVNIADWGFRHVSFLDL